jgi:hypothetical protein
VRAVTITIGTSVRARSSRVTSMPSRPGSMTSSTMQSYCRRSASAWPSMPFAAIVTSTPCDSR